MTGRARRSLRQPGGATRAWRTPTSRSATPTIEQQPQAARRKNAATGRALLGQQAWHDAVVRAIYNHPDGIAIMKAAADLAERGYGRRPRRVTSTFCVEEQWFDDAFEILHGRRQSVDHWSDLQFQPTWW
ncbi:hypothetical protein [Streptomyces sp. NPDC050988]|uniref:hypothetical protein n=1 Tax=Streptomyces sp. NPDC050988 TaxID=3365637 RepID=UPI0037A4D2AE